jgi:hypothetical protein
MDNNIQENNNCDDFIKQIVKELKPVTEEQRQEVQK